MNNKKIFLSLILFLGISHNKTSQFAEMNDNTDRDMFGRTLLHQAIDNKDLNQVILLLSLKANIYTIDNFGWNALHHAAAKGTLDILHLIATKTMNLDIRTKHDWTALHHAAKRKSIEILKYLLLHGASVDLQNSAGEYAKDLSKTKETEFILNTLFNYLQGGDPVYQANTFLDKTNWKIILRNMKNAKGIRGLIIFSANNFKQKIYKLLTKNKLTDIHVTFFHIRLNYCSS